MNGVIALDKPAGMTSHDAVTAVKRMLGAGRAGHTGTLDPLATGVLPVCLDEATKLSPFLVTADKEYRATMLLGVRTDTQDVEGDVLRREDPRVDAQTLSRILEGFQGVLRQRPPRYSAIKHRGQPLHRWARRGVFVEAAPRDVEIREILLETVDLPYATFRVACGKGTYIRSLCAEAGERLGCGACLSGLRRIRAGIFHVDDAVSLERVDVSRALSMTDALAGIPPVVVCPDACRRLRNGWQPTAGFLAQQELSFLAQGDMIQFVSPARTLVAVGRLRFPAAEAAGRSPGEQAVTILRVFHEDVPGTGQAGICIQEGEERC